MSALAESVESCASSFPDLYSGPVSFTSPFAVFSVMDRLQLTGQIF